LALEERRGKIDPARFGRIAELAASRKQQRREALTTQARGGSGITKAFMNWTFAEARQPDMIVVDEYWARADALASTIEGTEYHNPPAGGLGWGLPAALGVQMESPGRTVISTLGDGAYLFANPPACHQVMASNGLPIITIVCNNGRWGAVEGSARGMYPQGNVAAATETSPLATLDQSHGFELYAEATGGYGEKVTTRDEFAPALQRAFDVVKNEQRHVVLNVLSTD
jgi:acetolactate synthase-1/2/3 large subunit